MASKLRCRSCRDYFDRVEMFCVGFCSSECLAAHRSRQKNPKAPRRKKPTRDATFTPALKAQVRERDGNCCQWCGAAGELECHHIILRGQGPAELLDQMWDLIALCDDCHAKAHSDVKRWQPILLLAVSVGLTVPQADLEYLGYLPEGPWAEHPHGRRWMQAEDPLSPTTRSSGDEPLSFGVQMNAA